MSSCQAFVVSTCCICTCLSLNPESTCVSYLCYSFASLFMSAFVLFLSLACLQWGTAEFGVLIPAELSIHQVVSEHEDK